jgi:hypothetical protein
MAGLSRLQTCEGSGRPRWRLLCADAPAHSDVSALCSPHTGAKPCGFRAVYWILRWPGDCVLDRIWPALNPLRPAPRCRRRSGWSAPIARFANSGIRQPTRRGAFCRSPPAATHSNSKPTKLRCCANLTRHSPRPWRMPIAGVWNRVGSRQVEREGSNGRRYDETAPPPFTVHALMAGARLPPPPCQRSPRVTIPL